MPSNPGLNPYENQKDPPMVDLKYRNGWIVRKVHPSKYRWKSWGHQSQFDISEYQESGK